MKKTLISIIILVGLLSFGCASTPKSFDQALLLIDKAAALAEKQGIAYDATLRWDGKLAASFIQRGELDSGVIAEINFHGNAAAQRATVNP